MSALSPREACDLIYLAWGHPVCASVQSATSVFAVLSSGETRAGSGPFRPKAVGIADAQLRLPSNTRTRVENATSKEFSVFVPQSTT